MTRWLIYCRKSTDRDDKQANSLEHQLNNCRNTLATLGFTLVREIVESVSAKEEYKRAGFNEMVELCKKKQVDFIIIDEPKRLSRNNIDTSRIIDLMDKNMIRGIYATSRQYLSTNSRDKFLLQLDLSLSKMDNEDRSSDTKAKMITCAKKGRCLGKAPFGYRNFTIKKGQKTIIVEKSEAEIVKTIFRLRKEWFSYGEIGRKIQFLHNTTQKFSIDYVFKITHNTFYIGKVKFAWEEYEGKHEAIITKTLFNEVQAKDRWVYTWTPNPEERYPLKWYLRDPSNITLNAYETNWYTYYKSQSRSNEKVNISEWVLYKQLEEIVKEYDTKWIRFSGFSNDIIWDIMTEYLKEKEGGLKDIQEMLIILEEKKSSLLDMKLDKKVNEEMYEKKYREFEKNWNELIERKEKIKKVQIEKIWEIQKKMVELSGSLYGSYKWMNPNWKSLLVKNMMVELFVSNKKELTVEENKLFKVVKMFDFYDGNATENWTPVYGMKTRCLNHWTMASWQ